MTDCHGRLVGIRTAPPQPAEETEATRLWQRRKNLAKTGEMRSQAELRNHFAPFHVDPASSPRR